MLSISHFVKRTHFSLQVFGKFKRIFFSVIVLILDPLDMNESNYAVQFLLFLSENLNTGQFVYLK